MENVTVAIGVSILVVLILLFSCWGKKKKVPKSKGKTSSCSQQQTQLQAQQDLLAQQNDDAQQFYAPTGTGRINATLANQYSQLNGAQYQDWNEATQAASLEPEVFKSQAEYTADINNSTSGASAMSIRSDDNYPIPFVGLRRPDMQSVYADSTARVEQSEYPDSMPAPTSYLID